MSLLGFEPSGSSRTGSKKPFKLVLGIGALVATIALGSTLAASISLNGGGPVEFGQGVTQTTACDDQVKLTPISSFSNDEESGFKFTAITLSDLDGTTQTDVTDKGCAGKSFTIKSYDSGGNLLTPSYSIVLDMGGNFSSPDGNTDGNGTEGESDGSVKLTFDSPSIDAESVYQITIESSGVATGQIADGLIADYNLATVSVDQYTTFISNSQGGPRLNLQNGTPEFSSANGGQLHLNSGGPGNIAETEDLSSFFLNPYRLDKSLFIWIKPISDGNVVVEYGDTSHGWNDSQIEIVNGYINFRLWNFSQDHFPDVIGSTNILDGNWHLVGFTYDGTTLTGYQDGNVVGTAAVNQNDSVSYGNDLYYGLGGSASPIGNIEQLSDFWWSRFLVYNKAISQSTASALFDNTKGVFGY
ncbi:unannotated protein [freshwater metagenome]|uniref:Unannotated protein n=1 Tax=freshwater metagenome TaxID=449393 RepID=A0A6J6UB60_9ZZZZ|nr:hypothetical protein [Actinomycetota bacterium]